MLNKYTVAVFVFIIYYIITYLNMRFNCYFNSCLLFKSNYYEINDKIINLKYEVLSYINDSNKISNINQIYLLFENNGFLDNKEDIYCTTFNTLNLKDKDIYIVIILINYDKEFDVKN